MRVFASDKLSLFMVLLMLLQLAGCGGGGGSSDGDGIGSNVAAPTLSAAKLAPGRILTISHPQIDAGETVAVTFQGSNGYRVTANAAVTGSGYAQIAVPPFMNLAVDPVAITSGQVTVAIAGVARTAPLTIDALPQITGFEPGEITMAMLDLSSALSDELADKVWAKMGVEALDWLSAIYDQQDLLQTCRDQVAAGTLSLTSPAGSHTLTLEAIALLDRMILAYYQGLADFAGMNVNTVLITPSQLFDFRQAMRNALVAIKEKGIPGMQVLGSYLTVGVAVVTAVDAVISPTKVESVIPATFVVAIGLITTVGMGICSFFTDAAIDKIDGQDFDDTRALANALQVTYSGFASIALSFVGGLEWAGANLVSAASTVIDFITGLIAMRDVACDDANSPQGLRRSATMDLETFCNETENIVPLTVSLVEASSELAVGAAGSYAVQILGGELPYVVSYQWGDGSSDSVAATKESTAAHQFEQAGTFTVKIVVVDASQNAAAVQTSTVVKSAMEVEWISSPAVLDLNTSANWAVAIQGGSAPFSVVFSWGDGSQSAVAADVTASASHAYAEAGAFTVGVTVTDAVSNSKQLSAAVTVGGGESECSDISGTWYGTQSSTLTCTDLSDPSDTWTETFPPVSGQLNLSQTGCSFSDASGEFDGTVSDDVVTMTYYPTINSTRGEGQLSGMVENNSMLLSGSGSVIGDGLSCTDNTTMTLTRDSAAKHTGRRFVRHVGG